MRKILHFLIMCLPFFFYTLPLSAKVIDRIVAIVNDDVITLSELNEMTNYLTHQDNPPLEIKRKVLEDLINSRLALQEAEKLGIHVSEEEIDMAIKELLVQNGATLEDLKRDLAKNGISFKEYKEWLKEQIVKSKLLALEVQGKVTVTDEEIKKYYEAHKDKYKGHTEYHLRHILLLKPQDPTEIEQIKKIQKKILQLLKEGVPFCELARRYSQAPTAQDGGDLGWLKEKELAPKIKNAVKKLKPGEVTPWLDTDAGYQLVQLIEKRKTPDKPLAEVKNQIYKILYKKKVEQRYKRWLEQLRQKGYIKILL